MSTSLGWTEKERAVTDSKDPALFASPPYIAHQHFEIALAFFAKHGVPADLRSASLPIAPSARVQLLPAMRYLGLADQRMTSTETLLDLVASLGTPEFPSKLAAILRTGYPDLQMIDLETATPGELSKAMMERGVSAGIGRKAIRFYLNAATRAGFKVGPRLRFGRKTSRSSAVAKSGGRRRIDPHATLLRQELINRLPRFDEAWSDRVKVAWLKVCESLSDRA
jgi:hypothetical protein